MGQGLSEKEFCRQKPYIPGCKKYLNGGGSKPFPCCRANNAKCLSCVAGLTEEEYCKKNPTDFFWRSARLREVQGLLQGKQRQVPLLRRGLERGRVLQEEPIYWRLREVQELLPGIQCQVRVLQAGHQRGRVLQEEPI